MITCLVFGGHHIVRLLAAPLTFSLSVRYTLIADLAGWKFTAMKQFPLTVTILLGMAGSSPAQDALRPDQIFQRTLRGATLILTDKGTKGSGWLLHPGLRLVMTNAHVLRDAKEIHVLFAAIKDGRAVG